MKKNISKIIVLFFVFIFFSCIGYKDRLFKGKGNIEQARENAIIDFANTYKTPKDYIKRRNGKPFDIFWVTEQKVTNDMFILGIIPEIQGRVSLSVEDSLGKVPKSYFPNRYRIEKEKLFIWKDDVTPLNREILNVINKFGILDSMDIKIEMGLYPIDKEMLDITKNFSGSLDELI